MFSKIISRNIRKYGVEVVLKKRTVTGKDEYGHPVFSYNEENAKAIVYVPKRKDYETAIKEPGVLKKRIAIFLFSPSVDVAELDVVVYNDEEYVVRRVEKIRFEGSVIAVKVWGLSSE